MESNNQQILPIDMVLFCPDCGKQHVDKIEPEVCQDCGHRSGDHFNAGERNVCGGGAPGDENDCKCTGFTAWLNPPHKSHRCHFCNHVWRPADVATNGVAEIKTHGENDSFPPAPENPRYRQKLVSRGWENPETLRAARDIAEMLTRMSLGQTKYFCQIVEQHVFPKMSQKEYESAAAFFTAVGVYFGTRAAQPDEDRRFPLHDAFLDSWQSIRSWKNNEQYFHDIYRLLCVVACETPDCGERLGVGRDCWETRRWGCLHDD